MAFIVQISMSPPSLPRLLLLQCRRVSLARSAPISPLRPHCR